MIQLVGLQGWTPERKTAVTEESKLASDLLTLVTSPPSGVFSWQLESSRFPVSVNFFLLLPLLKLH